MLKEASAINNSLLTLGTVISDLSKGKDKTKISFRQSKLTRLLSNSLGGNANTGLICCISPAAANREESKSTLQVLSLSLSPSPSLSLSLFPSLS